MLSLSAYIATVLTLARLFRAVSTGLGVTAALAPTPRLIPCLQANWQHSFRVVTKRSGRRYTCHHFEIAGLRCLHDYLSQRFQSFVGLTGTDRRTPRRYRCKSTTPSPYRVPKGGTAFDRLVPVSGRTCLQSIPTICVPSGERYFVVSSIACPSCSRRASVSGWPSAPLPDIASA